jgi:hypothetical protein
MDKVQKPSNSEKSSSHRYQSLMRRLDLDRFAVARRTWENYITMDLTEVYAEEAKWQRSSPVVDLYVSDKPESPMLTKNPSYQLIKYRILKDDAVPLSYGWIELSWVLCYDRRSAGQSVWE